VDLLAPPLARRALLAAAAARRGYDPAGSGVRRILRDVERFLESEPGQRLAAWERAGALRREVPFLLRLDDPAAPVYLDGAIDALALDGDGVSVLDFKYAAFRPDAARRYRLQLAAYALAASRAWPGRSVRASLWFLRGASPSADLTPSAVELERFAREAPALARGVARADGRDVPPDALGRSEALCRGERCGFADHCFAASRRPPAPPPRRAGGTVRAAEAEAAIAGPDARFGNAAMPLCRAIQGEGELVSRASRANPSSRREP